MAMQTSIAELQTLTESEKMYRMNERLEEFHASNYDWKRVLEDKWALAKWGQNDANPFLGR